MSNSGEERKMERRKNVLMQAKKSAFKQLTAKTQKPALNTIKYAREYSKKEIQTMK